MQNFFKQAQSRVRTVVVVTSVKAVVLFGALGFGISIIYEKPTLVNFVVFGLALLATAYSLVECPLRESNDLVEDISLLTQDLLLTTANLRAARNLAARHILGVPLDCRQQEVGRLLQASSDESVKDSLLTAWDDRVLALEVTDSEEHDRELAELSAGTAILMVAPTSWTEVVLDAAKVLNVSTAEANSISK